jgi:predicted glycosyltransferase
MRSNIFTALGWVTGLKPPEELTTEELAQTILCRLQEPCIPDFPREWNGTTNVINEIKKLLRERNLKEALV